LSIDPEVLKPVTSLRTIHELEPTSAAYFKLVDRALAQEPDNLHLQLIRFRGLVDLGDHQRASKMAAAFIERPDATFSALSEATRYLDQHVVADQEQRKSLMHEAVTKLVELDLPDAYVADQYYLSKRYQVPLHDKLNEKLCVAGAGKVTVRERCELAQQALENNQNFYRALARAGL
jgi:hypothetical protein